MKPIIGSKKNNKFAIKAFLIIAAILASFFIFNIFKKQVRNFFYALSSPMQKFLWKAGNEVFNFTTSIINAGRIKKNFNELSEKNKELASEISALKELKEENIQLRQALGFELQKDFKLIFVQTLSKDASGDLILVDKGEKDGISKNMAVITSQKIIVGRISEVYNSFSKVMLITDKKSSFDARTQEKNVLGMAKGGGSQKIIFDLVSRDKEISEGDAVVTANLGGIFPPGILVGWVSKIIKNDVEPFQNIEIRPAFSKADLDYLFVIKP